MNIDFTAKILDENDEPVKDGPFQTLRSTCVTACLSQIRGDESLSPEKKGELGFLGLQVQHSDTLDLRAEQVATLKERVGKIAPNLVVHRAFMLLDPRHEQKPATSAKRRANGAAQPAA